MNIVAENVRRTSNQAETVAQIFRSLRRTWHWTSLVAAAMASLSVAQARIVPESDHTVWIIIDSVPVGAEVFALPKDHSASIRLGSTPCRIPVDINWGRRWFVRQWDRVEAKSPGNVCWLERRADNGYDVRISMRLTKPGFESRDLDTVVCFLAYPGKRWAQKALWPRETRVSVELLPAINLGTDAQPLEDASLRRVLVAAGDASSATGLLVLRSDVESAEVWVDGRRVAKVPVELVLSEGSHRVEVRKAGFSTVTRKIFIQRDARHLLHVNLSPEADSR